MKVRKVLNGNHLFVNNFTSNRYGFNHISTLFLGEKEVGKINFHCINKDFGILRLSNKYENSYKWFN